MTTTDQPIDQSGLEVALHAQAQGATGPSLMDMIKAQRGAIERALPNVGITPERFTRLVTTEVRRNQELASCEPISVLGALMYAAQLGLEIGPLGHAYLVPYRRQATFILGYKGIIALAWRSKLLASIEARPVREGDEFRYAHGLHEELHHVPHPEEARRGKATHYYAIARYTNGGHYWEVMSIADVERRKARSASAKARVSPWKSDYDAMAAKTVIRSMAPYLPLSAEFAEAVASDERVRIFDPDAAGATRLAPEVPAASVPEPEVEPEGCAAGDGPFSEERPAAFYDEDGKPYHDGCAPT